MRIAFVTSSRSDWALIAKVVEKAKEIFDVNLIVTGAHLSKHYGKTIKDVGLADDRIDILMLANSPLSTATSIGLGVIKFAEVFARKKYDYVFLAGDRFEILSAAIAAFTIKTKIIHYCGGEKTGTQDQAWRDMITAMAQYHLVQHELYKLNIFQKNPHAKIYTVGSTLADNILEIKYDDEKEIKQKYGVGNISLLHIIQTH